MENEHTPDLSKLPKNKWGTVDITGVRFGHLVVLCRDGSKRSYKPQHSQKNRSLAMWCCLCVCGKKIKVTKNQLTTKKRRCCGCEVRKTRRISILPIQGHNRNKEVTVAENTLYSDLRNSAKRRDLEVTISKTEWAALIRCNCKYCGTPPQVKISRASRMLALPDILANGIDRINSSKGYIPNNVVPSCMICNRAKSNMPPKDWIIYLKRLSAHLIANLAKLEDEYAQI